MSTNGRTRLGLVSAIVCGAVLAACGPAGGSTAPSTGAMASEGAMASDGAMGSPMASAMASEGAMASDGAMGSPMASAMVAYPMNDGSGEFHAVDGNATGMATLFHLEDGTFQVTLANVHVDGNAQVHVVLVDRADVQATSDVDPSTLLDLGPLVDTSGTWDYPLPAMSAASAMGYHAVVLWDPGMGHAIAAAPLGQ